MKNREVKKERKAILKLCKKRKVEIGIENFGKIKKLIDLLRLHSKLLDFLLSEKTEDILIIGDVEVKVRRKFNEASNKEALEKQTLDQHLPKVIKSNKELILKFLVDKVSSNFEIDTELKLPKNTTNLIINRNSELFELDHKILNKKFWRLSVKGKNFVENLNKKENG